MGKSNIFGDNLLEDLQSCAEDDKFKKLLSLEIGSVLEIKDEDYMSLVKVQQSLTNLINKIRDVEFGSPEVPVHLVDTNHPNIMSLGPLEGLTYLQGPMYKVSKGIVFSIIAGYAKQEKSTLYIGSEPKVRDTVEFYGGEIYAIENRIRSMFHLEGSLVEINDKDWDLVVIDSLLGPEDFDLLQKVVILALDRGANVLLKSGVLTNTELDNLLEIDRNIKQQKMEEKKNECN